MSVNNFIPELWANRIYTRLRKAYVFANLFNRDYEGQIAEQGDVVKITSIGRPTIGSYTKNSTSVSPEYLHDAQTNLIINQAKYFAFAVDDIDARQASSGVNLIAAGMDEAADGLADTADAFLATLHDQAGSISSSTAINSLNAQAALLALAQALTEANCPLTGRVAIIPPWYTTKLVLAKTIVENTSNTAFETGYVGQCAGFALYQSNNVHLDTSTYNIMAGTNRCGTFAEQISSVEAYRPEAGFKDAVKGLHVYGAKIVDPACLATLVCTVAAEP